MPQPDSFASFTPGRQLYAERMLDAGPLLPEALIAAARAIEAGIGSGPFVYAGVPPRSIALTVDAVAAWLDDVRGQRRTGRGAPALFTLAADPFLTPGVTLSYEEEPWPENAVGFLRCSLPDENLPPAGAMVALVAEVSRGFGAHRGNIEDDLLLMRYRGARAAERARSAVPPHLRQYVPAPLPVEGVSGNLPDLLVPQEFDRRHVPDAVWWINVWDAEMVATVGRDRIERAPWRRIVELPGGALGLAATDAPTDPASHEDLIQLTRLVDALELRALQEAYRYAT
jgi:hypothetical protein